MDLVWYDGGLMIVVIVLALIAMVNESKTLGIAGVMLAFFVLGDAAHRAKDDGSSLAKRVKTALVDQGFPPPNDNSDGHTVMWLGAFSCQLTFKLRQSGDKWAVVNRHRNRPSTLLTPSQLSELLSDPVCN